MSINEIDKEIIKFQDKQESLRKMRNVLIKSGLKQEADKSLTEITRCENALSILFAKRDSLIYELSEAIMYAAFTIDCAYAYAINLQEKHKQISGYQSDFAEGVCRIKNALHEIIKTIDEEKLPMFSIAYADATADLDEIFDERLRPALKEVWGKHKDKLMRTYLNGKEYKERHK